MACSVPKRLMTYLRRGRPMRSSVTNRVHLVVAKMIPKTISSHATYATLLRLRDLVAVSLSDPTQMWDGVEAVRQGQLVLAGIGERGPPLLAFHQVPGGVHHGIDTVR